MVNVPSFPSISTGLVADALVISVPFTVTLVTLCGLVILPFQSLYQQQSQYLRRLFLQERYHL